MECIYFVTSIMLLKAFFEVFLQVLTKLIEHVETKV